MKIKNAVHNFDTFVDLFYKIKNASHVSDTLIIYQGGLAA